MSCFRVRILAEMSHWRTVKSTILHLMLKILSSIRSLDSRISSRGSSFYDSVLASGANRSSLEMSYATKGIASSFLFIKANSYAGSSCLISSNEVLVGSIIEISDSGIFYSDAEVLLISIPANRLIPPIGFGSSLTLDYR